MNPASERRLRIGIAGLGRAFTVMLPTFTGDPRIVLAAAADPRAEARQRFAADFAAPTYESVEALCADPSVEIVYIATPHQHHAAHTALAAAHGKHVLVEKPMAVTLVECDAMIAAARSAGVHLIVGHSHSFDAPVRRTRELITGGRFGAVRMITALNYTDFLYRPRRSDELDTTQGGGVVFSQGAHQVDIVRLLGGGLVRSVRAATGVWDAARPTEGAYTALLTFAGGTSASLTYSGYGHFDSDEWLGWIGELGEPKDPERYGAARAMLAQAPSPAAEAALKAARNYGGAQDVMRMAKAGAPTAHNHFGSVIASCERADLRPMANGVMIYEDARRRLDPLPPPTVRRGEVIDEVYDAVVNGRPPLHDGEWSRATLEVCLAILRSAREQREVTLQHQVPPRE